MNQRALGTTGLKVSDISFGAWQLGNRDDWEPMSERTARSLVAEALDAGVNLFDTAPNYAGSESERLLGEALAGRRDDVVLVSKYGRRPDNTKDLSVERFQDGLHGTLKRLRTDRVDVLLLHNPDRSVYEPDHPLWERLETAREQGKIRHYGASLDFAAEVEACLANTGSTVLEILFNVLHQDVRRAFGLVRERGAGTIVKIPLDSGWLTGRFDAESRFRGVRSRWTAEQIARRAELVERLGWLTADGTSLAAKALAYVLSYPEVSCAIPGVRTPEQLRQNLAASGTSLSAAEVRRLEAFWDDLTGSGSRPLPW
jgi:aryl-alcohol dehydrogenase-like predicted oxidoreductase